MHIHPGEKINIGALKRGNSRTGQKKKKKKSERFEIERKIREISCPDSPPFPFPFSGKICIETGGGEGDALPSFALFSYSNALAISRSFYPR